MVEDAKGARDRRLAEALRANLKRRKTAKTMTERKTAHATDGAAEAPAEPRLSAEGDF